MNKYGEQKKNGQAGFTLIEILIVVMIIWAPGVICRA